MLALRRDLEAATRSKCVHPADRRKRTGKDVACTYNECPYAARENRLLSRQPRNIHRHCLKANYFASKGPARVHQTFSQTKRFFLRKPQTEHSFLTNIHNLAADHQAKFNRFYKNGSFNRVNGNWKSVRARFITATTRISRRLVQQGKFRAESCTTGSK